TAYLVHIKIEALDRPRLLTDIALVISEQQVNLHSAPAQSHSDRLATSFFSFELADPSHLQSVLSHVRRIEGVYAVDRVTADCAPGCRCIRCRRERIWSTSTWPLSTSPRTSGAATGAGVKRSRSVAVRTGTVTGLPPIVSTSSVPSRAVRITTPATSPRCAEDSSSAGAGCAAPRRTEAADGAAMTWWGWSGAPSARPGARARRTAVRSRSGGR